MARRHEFDVREENVGAYYMLRDRGEPVAAIAVFLHRRFRHGFLFINRDHQQLFSAPKSLLHAAIRSKFAQSRLAGL